mmetsp:Transcript_57079/g.177141  ORF Transcript_57079/g.177141 Transcript_57079/m.177141 type:complete len:253 (+) Transcript_57079:309-1067(+)
MLRPPGSSSAAGTTAATRWPMLGASAPPSGAGESCRRWPHHGAWPLWQRWTGTCTSAAGSATAQCAAPSASTRRRASGWRCRPCAPSASRPLQRCWAAGSTSAGAGPWPRARTPSPQRSASTLGRGSGRSCPRCARAASWHAPRGGAGASTCAGAATSPPWSRRAAWSQGLRTPPGGSSPTSWTPSRPSSRALVGRPCPVSRSRAPTRPRPALRGTSTSAGAATALGPWTPWSAGTWSAGPGRRCPGCRSAG